MIVYVVECQFLKTGYPMLDKPLTRQLYHSIIRIHFSLPQIHQMEAIYFSIRHSTFSGSILITRVNEGLRMISTGNLLLPELRILE